MTRKKGADALPAPFIPDFPSSMLAPTSDMAAQRKRLLAKFKQSTIPDPLELNFVDSLSTGSLCLDLVTGVGGYARGRLTTIAGEEHAGKTALGLLAMGTLQRTILQTQNRVARCAVIDTEQAFSYSLAALANCDASPDALILARPEDAEQALDVTMSMLGYESRDKGRTYDRVSDPFDMILFDSWGGAATTSRARASLARVGAEWLPTICVHLNRTQAALVMTNHIREDPDVTFGNPEYEPGGKAVGFYRSLGLRIHKGKAIKGLTTQDIGHELRIDIIKNKLGQRYKNLNIRLDYRLGFDPAMDVVRFFDMIGHPIRGSASEDTFADRLRDDASLYRQYLLAAQQELAIRREHR